MILGLILSAAVPAAGKPLSSHAYQLPGLVRGNLGLPVRLPSIPFPVSAIGRPAIELPAPRAIPVLFSSALEMKASGGAPKALIGRQAVQGFSLKALNKLFDNTFVFPQAR